MEIHRIVDFEIESNNIKFHTRTHTRSDSLNTSFDHITKAFT